VTIEKLLRTTEVKRIYVLLRSKRGQEMKERCEAWELDPVKIPCLKKRNKIAKTNKLHKEGYFFGFFKFSDLFIHYNPYIMVPLPINNIKALPFQVFDNLMKVDPDVLNRVVPLGGDCQESDLGLSTSDRQVLVDEVQIVLHIAATVRFMEPLHIALAVNTRATRLMIQLAKEMPHLEAFVHVSTAYSNCVIENVSERFYPEHLTCPVQKVLELQESLSPEMLDSMAPALMGRYPNTYTYTKALAEQLLQQESGDLPICIFRPGVSRLMPLETKGTI